MAGTVEIIDLRALGITPGGARRIEGRAPAVDLVIGGQDYVTDPAEPEVVIDVSRSLSGLHGRLRLRAGLVGPCWRCTEPARVPIDVDAREFQADGREGAAPPDDDLDSDYVADERFDAAAWVRDAIAEAVPTTILCRDDCAGLCPTCGADLNAGDCGCDPAPADPRWEGLRELAERLGEDPRTG